MTKSATEVMQEIMFSAVIDAVGALKTASKGLPNNLLRDINAVHANATFADLPAELQAAINESVRQAFNRLLKEGYSVAPGRPAPAPSRAVPRDPNRTGDRPRRGPAPDRPNSRGPRGPRPGGPPGGGRPKP
ncbi:hypothetical protein [Sphingomonas sp. ID0503]|uniref:hypothetical protein n=1 Tax=Sphingomonas sp. ID0503 TaxID=3399691 RepID=UPI003AFA7466